MNPEDLCWIARDFTTKDDRALLRLVAVESDQYRAEIVELARRELISRNLPVPSAEEYFQLFPTERIGDSGFCQACLDETTSETPGNTTTYNIFIGTRLIGLGAACPACGSVVQTKYFCLFVPLTPLARYRIIYLSRSRYVGRRLRSDYGATLQGPGQAS